MEPQVTTPKVSVELILYVNNQQKSRDFYAFLLQQDPCLDVPGMTEFLIADNTKLGLIPENGIANILQPIAPHPATGSGIPRCELYLLLKNPDDFINRLKKLNSLLISEFKQRDWGHEVAYFADPDGHIIAIARESPR